MSDNITDGAECSRFKKLCAAAAAGLMLLALTGCADKNEETDSAEAMNTAALPSVTQFSSEAESLRMTEETTASSSLPLDGELDSETVSAGDAASSQTESETEISAETTVSESETFVQTTESVFQTTAVPVTDNVTESLTQTAASEIVTECSVPMAQTPVSAASSDYDSEFFENDLFIGDSISTGYSLYGFLKDKNVFAKVGLNPSTVLTKTVSTCYGDIGISDMLAYTNPKRVYIMLGSNGIQWLSVGSMLQSTDILVSLIEECCPDTEVMIVSVPPVTPEYDSTVEDVDVMAKINEYNTSLSAYCTAKNMLFIDAGSVLKNSSGYFDYAYAESDGMHFKSSAYKTLLSKIQSDVTDFEAENSAKETVSSEETIPGEETSAPDEEVTGEASETTAPDDEAETVSETEETKKSGKKQSETSTGKKLVNTSQTAEEKNGR